MTTPVVKNLVVINAIIWAGTALLRLQEPVYTYLALFPMESPLFRPIQLVTHLFLHGNFAHLFFNMYALILFGVPLERMWGSKKFLLFYFVTGIGAGLCHCLVMHLQISGLISGTPAMQLIATPTIGASGAVYGVLLGYAMLYPNTILQLLIPPVTMKVKYLVIIYAVIEMGLGLLGRDGIAHFAHLGGMIFGLGLILLWKKQRKLYS